MNPGEANQFNILDEARLFDAATALLSSARSDFMDRYKFDITPATDNKPHFFHFFKWRSLPELIALPTGGRGSLVEWGYLILVATIVQAFIVGLSLILVPLWITGRKSVQPAGARMGFYFGALGLAFIFIEIAFMQKFILFLNHPLYAIAVVLSGFPCICRTWQRLLGSPGTTTGKHPLLADCRSRRWYCWIKPDLCDFSNLHIYMAGYTAGCSQDHRGYRFDRAVGILYGHAVPVGAGEAGSARAGLHSLGMGYQWLCLGCQCGPGDPARYPLRIHRGGAAGARVLPVSGRACAASALVLT